MNKITRKITAITILSALTLGLSGCVVTGDLTKNKVTSSPSSTESSTSTVKNEDVQQQISADYALIMSAVNNYDKEAFNKLSALYTELSSHDHTKETETETQADAEAEYDEALGYLKDTIGEEVYNKLDISDASTDYFLRYFAESIPANEDLGEQGYESFVIAPDKIVIEKDKATFKMSDVTLTQKNGSSSNVDYDDEEIFIKSDSNWLYSLPF